MVSNVWDEWMDGMNGYRVVRRSGHLLRLAQATRVIARYDEAVEMNQAEITYDRIAPQLMSKSGIGFEWYQNIKLQECQSSP